MQIAWEDGRIEKKGEGGLGSRSGRCQNGSVRLMFGCLFCSGEL